MQLHSKAKWEEPQEHMNMCYLYLKAGVSISETNLKNGVDEEAKRNLAQLCCLFLILSQGAQPEERQENVTFLRRQGVWQLWNALHLGCFSDSGWLV